jgi:hypothetical protein
MGGLAGIFAASRFWDESMFHNPSRNPVAASALTTTSDFNHLK